MDKQLNLTYQDYKEHYEKLLKDGWTKGDQYLCLLPDGTFWNLTEAQKGYQNAIDKTPVPEFKKCDVCKHVETDNKPPITKEVIERRVKEYRKALGEIFLKNS